MTEDGGQLVLVAALGRGRAIGKAGGLPWHAPEDLKHFKALTLEHAIIMGRKTFESIGRALPRRRNIVISRATKDFPAGVEHAASLEQAIALARSTDPVPHVIGGGEIYSLALPLATALELTLLDQEVPDADAFFPEFEHDFISVSERAAETPGMRFVRLERRSAP